jgi:competence ComEA-like helix-hairpin-helix protein
MILLVWNTLALCDIPAAPSFRRSFHLDRRAPCCPRWDEGRTPPSTARQAPGAVPFRQDKNISLESVIDINNALKDEINALPGISDAMADAIVAERERVGGFRSPEDLLKVKGIKEKRLKKILPFLMKMENN